MPDKIQSSMHQIITHMCGEPLKNFISPLLPPSNSLSALSLKVIEKQIWNLSSQETIPDRLNASRMC